MRYLLFIALFLCWFQSFSQYQYKTGKSELVRREGFTKLSGWNLAPGVTWMGTRWINKADILFESGDTTYEVTFNPGGRIGLYLEVGRHYIFKYARLFPYLDFGIAYKGLRGKEKFEGEWRIANIDQTFGATSGAGKFANHNVLAYVNLNNIIQLTNKLFIQNSLGLNVDYSFIKRTNKGTYAFQDDVELPRLWAQVHYKFGLGIKIHDGLFIIPSIETPLLNLSPWTNFRLKVPQYMSWYRPLILSVRFAFLGQKKTTCNTPNENKGDGTNPGYR